MAVVVTCGGPNGGWAGLAGNPGMKVRPPPGGSRLGEESLPAGAHWLMPFTLCHSHLETGW